jgi:hypothetical protein
MEGNNLSLCQEHEKGTGVSVSEAELATGSGLVIRFYELVLPQFTLHDGKQHIGLKRLG